MTYYRIHTADIAYITQQPRGIFTAIWKLVEAKILPEEELPGEVVYEDDFQIAVKNQKADANIIVSELVFTEN